MAVQVSYPGVYIEEFTPGAPIEGVGTSTAAFLGVSQYGTPSLPTRITSWDDFLKQFWRPEQEPDDANYLWYAVRGFFENGGRTCFVVAVTNAKPDTVTLRDMATSPKETVVITAREARASSGLNVKAEAQSTVAGPQFFRPSPTIHAAAGTDVELNDEADAAQFRAGDRIRIAEGNLSEPAVVSRVDGKFLRLVSTLANPHGAVTVQLDAFPAGATTFRAEGASKLAAGSAIRISQQGKPNLDARVTQISAERISPALTTYRVTVDKSVSNFNPLAASDIIITPQEFKLTVRSGTTVVATYEELAMDPGHPRYFARIVNNDPAGVIVAEPVEPPNVTPIADNRPRTPANQNNGFADLTGGADQNMANILPNDFKEALTRLERIDDVNLVSAPGRDDMDTQLALIAHCEKMQDRFALLATARGAPMFGASGAEGLRRGADSTRGYAALYFPWLLVSSVKSGERIQVPPTGHVAGVIARIDNQRGVHKAPAGAEAIVNGVLGVAQPMSDDEQGVLNRIGVNVIRVFQTGGRSVVWGARTTATDRNWQYVNIRRLFLFLEESIQEGIRWAVFEPNNTALWQKLKRSISAFLTQQWREGALFGEKVEDAFYVRIDETLNPDTERALGRLTIEIGVRPSYPAEFIIVRIGIWQGGSEVTE